MKNLIQLFEKKYFKIGYPKNKLELYYTYLFLQNKINEYEDNELKILFDNLELPKPSTLKELDVYRECVDFIGDIRISKTGNKSIGFYDEEYIKEGYHIVEEDKGVLSYRVGDENA